MQARVKGLTMRGTFPAGAYSAVHRAYKAVTEPFPEQPLLQEVETATSFCFLCKPPAPHMQSSLKIICYSKQPRGLGDECSPAPVRAGTRQAGSAQTATGASLAPCIHRPPCLSAATVHFTAVSNLIFPKPSLRRLQQVPH